jgi:tRNA (guanine9-N1)-methyltransferase
MMEESERPKKLQKREQPETSNNDSGDSASRGDSIMAGPLLGGLIENGSTNQGDKPHGGSKSPEPTLNGSLKDCNTENENVSNITVSKRQLKKLQRREKWASQRQERRALRKEKNIERRQRKREKVQAAFRAHAAGVDTETFKNLSSQRRKQSKLVPLTLVVDCGFDELMNEKERVSLSTQLTRCYSDNNKASFRCHLALSSFNKQLKERFDTVLAKMYQSWREVRFLSEDFVYASELAKDWMRGPHGGELLGQLSDSEEPKPEDGEVVYLTSDSPYTLTDLKPYSTYIVGGLVDKNRHKGICYKAAMERGLKTAKLPIGEYMKMDSRFILATNHVVEIMLKWLELGDWGEAFIAVIPKRKGGVLKKDSPQTPANENDHDSWKSDKETDVQSREELLDEQARSSAESVLSETT